MLVDKVMVMMLLNFTTLWASSAVNKMMISFLILPQKIGFDISGKLSLFYGKNKKKYFKMSYAQNFTQNSEC